MKSNHVKTMAVLVLLAGGTSACTDIVTYNDNYDDGFTSVGAPVIEQVFSADDVEKENPITAGVFEQMLVLEGKNLSHVKKAAFNGVEVAVSEIYATAAYAYLPIPRKLPEAVDNKLYYETDLGSVSFDFEVSIPEVRVEGLYNEYCVPGDTVQLMGDYFDLYGFGGATATSTITMNGKLLEVDSISEGYLSVIIPKDAEANSVISIDYEGVNGHVVKKIAYRNNEGILFDFVNPSGNGSSSINKTDYITQGDEYGAPESIDGKPYVRLTGDFNSWAWSEWMNGNMAIDEDIASNPSGYVFKFETNSASNSPFYDGGYHFVIGDDMYTWNPSGNGSFNTYGTWRTVTIDLGEMAPSLREQGAGTYWYKFVINAPGVDWRGLDHSFTNFRIEKKL